MLPGRQNTFVDVACDNIWIEVQVRVLCHFSSRFCIVLSPNHKPGFSDVTVPYKFELRWCFLVLTPFRPVMKDNIFRARQSQPEGFCYRFDSTSNQLYSHFSRSFTQILVSAVLMSAFSVQSFHLRCCEKETKINKCTKRSIIQFCSHSGLFCFGLHQYRGRKEQIKLVFVIPVGTTADCWENRSERKCLTAMRRDANC